MVLIDYRRDIFYLQPDFLGEMIQFDKHSFQMGWFNHHLKAEADALWKQYLGGGETWRNSSCCWFFCCKNVGTFGVKKPGKLKTTNTSASKRDSYTHFRGIKLDANMYDMFEGIFFSGVFGVINEHCRRGVFFLQSEIFWGL